MARASLATIFLNITNNIKKYIYIYKELIEIFTFKNLSQVLVLLSRSLNLLELFNE